MSLDAAARQAVAQVLARAFHADPGFVYALPEESRRPSALTWLCARLVRYAELAGGLIDIAGAPPHGVALWYDVTDRYRLQRGALLRAGLWASPLALGPAAVRRLARLGELIDELHERHAPRPHRYLSQLGVDPPAQGRGTGSALLRPRLDEAARRGLACYLETFSERAAALYLRSGFTVAAEVRPPGLPRTWALVRPP